MHVEVASKMGTLPPGLPRLSLLLMLLTLPKPLIILQRFEYIVFGLSVRNPSRKILTQTVRPEADLLPLIGLFFAQDGFDHLNSKLALLG